MLGSFGDNELSPECLDGAQRFLKQDGISIPASYVYAFSIARIYRMILMKIPLLLEIQIDLNSICFHLFYLPVTAMPILGTLVSYSPSQLLSCTMMYVPSSRVA